jgi:amino acid adenylation domain-containing protein
MNHVEIRDDKIGVEIAVIGMAGRFPGAENVAEFWENLKNGVESVSFFTDEELEEAGFSQEELQDVNYVKARSIFEKIEYFDSLFFDYTPMETEIMDPQLRILHECAWEALEDAGYDPDSYEKLIGFYAGASSNLKWQSLVFLSHKDEFLGEFAANHLLDRDFLSTRISHRLNLRGPAVTLQTACSTSLVAVHMGCQGLLSGDCDIALAGGVTIGSLSKEGYFYQEGMIKSPDGHCRAFDANAKGTIFGSGVGIVVIKRLEDAFEDGDHIYAVIKGSAINNDGIEKAGYTAPSVKGQEEVIRNAHQMGEVEPESISYVETHGTGTALGDPVEIEALKLALNSGKKRSCAIGSVKTNVGHLDIAAGITSFIKTVLALKYRVIPPSLHFNTPNSNINFENSPFYVNTQLQEWKNNRYPLRAGVSSFGIGGTNVHVVLEEAPVFGHSSLVTDGNKKDRKYQLILLSAKTPSALEKMSQNLAEYLKRNLANPVNPVLSLTDVAYTLQVGRKAFKHRKMLVTSNVEETINLLNSDDETLSASLKVQTFSPKMDKPPVIFMFSGQGAQYVNMGLELYQTDTIFREEMDRCFDILNPLMGYNVKEILYPVSRDTSTNLNQTLITQPVLFVFEYALAQMLMKWGIKPYAMIGHSIGEYVAACLSSVFSLEDALKLVSFRGRLMQRMPTGAMRSISLSRDKLHPFLNDNISLAAVNSSNHCVISGTHEAVETWGAQMKANNHNTRKLHTSHAFHSNMMEPILKEFETEVAKVSLNKPQIPFISNVTGNWIAFEEAVNPGYWSKHIRQTVRFCEGLNKLLKKEPAILMEVGPGKSLSTFVRQHEAKKPSHKIINLVRHPHEDIPDSHFLLSRLGQCWLYGGRLDWSSFHEGEKRRRVSLPGYPFEGQRYWLDPDLLEANDIAIWKLGGKRPEGKKSLPGWFYIPSWKRTVIPVTQQENTSTPSNVLLFTDESSLGIHLRKGLQNSGYKVIIVKVADGFTREKESEYALNPGEVDDYEMLFSELHANSMIPRRIVHLWNISQWKNNEVRIEDNRQYQELGFYSLLYLARVLGKQDLSETVQITVLTTQMQEVNGAEGLCPPKSTILGPVMIIPLENTNIDCRSIDIELPLPSSGSRKEKRLVNRLIGEIDFGISDRIVAYRGPHRLIRTFEPVQLDIFGESASGLRIKQKGVYLVTGGLGGIGLVFAKHLAASRQARLILTGRSAFPPPEEWEQWLSVHGEFDVVSRKIRAIREMESLGAEVLVYPADVSDYLRMENLISLVEKRWGSLNGIIHCAGVASGGLIGRKKWEDAEEVLAPKVTGTLVLDRLIKLNKIDLDFMLLCSSVNSLVPIVGQVDYCAANAFLDAFAHYKTARDGVLTVSVNWDTWREVGMAVEAARGWSGTRSVGHPLLDRCKEISPSKNPEQEVYLSRFTFQGHWVLHEHMTPARQGVVPGTTYLEMVQAAYKTREGGGPVEINDVQFLTPLMVSEGEERDVALILRRQGSGYNFLIASRRGDGNRSRSGGETQNHAAGKICRATIEVEESKKHELEKIESLFYKGSSHEVIFSGRNDEFPESEGLLVFGPRWKSLKWVKHRKNHGLAFLELAEEYIEDLRSYKLHPALLDLATAFLNSLMNKQSAYIPFSYKRLLIKKDLPGRFLSYCRLLEDNSPVREQVRFDVTLFDEQGMELVTINEFTMLEVSEEMKDRIVESASGNIETGVVVSDIFEFGAVESEFLKNGILPSEGVDAFTRIAGSGLSQVVVSTTDLNLRVEKSGLLGAWRLSEEIRAVRVSGSARARPELGSAYTAPKSEIQQVLVEMWQELLGIGQVGINDDFFELGGDSLKAISLGGRIHKELNTEVPLAVFFNRPTIRKLSEHIEGTQETNEFYSVNPQEKKEYYSLSSAQKRLYILHQMEPVSIAHNLSEMVILEGKIEKEKIEDVFRRLIARHESFRTSLEIIHGGPVQRVHDRVEFEIECIPAGSAADQRESREMMEQNLIIGKIIRPFDLSRAPLLRVGLIEQEEHLHLLVVDVHHTIYDGTSQAVVFKEFMVLYAGERLPELSIQYKDYSEWQTRNLETESIKQQGNYWQNEFQGEIPVLNLPYDFIRPTVQSYKGTVVKFELSSDETKGLRILASQQGVTLYMVLFTIFTVLLSRLSSQQDIVIGTPTAGRKHPDLVALIGMFLNTLALRNYPALDKTFQVFLQEVKERILQAFENQDYPFEQLVEDLDVTRDLSRNPLFDVMFILHNELNSRRIYAGTQLEFKMKHHGFNKVTSQYDLTLVGFEVESENNIYFEMEYCIKLFNEGSIRRFVRYFKTAVSSILKYPEKKLSQIELISEEEMNQLLWEFNTTSLEYPREKSIHWLFEDQAAKFSGHTAVVGRGQETGSRELFITYNEVNQRADQLAYVLREKGVQPGTIIGIMVERRLELMVGLVGILKSGGAYLPLDPEYPQSRIQYILEKSDASVLVTQEDLFRKCSEVAFEGEVIDITTWSYGRLNFKEKYKEVASFEPAYVIYTSGSTGNPKGVVVTHCNGVNFITGMKEKINFFPGKRILALTTISFDIFFLETLLPLACGLQVVIADENQQADPRLLHDIIINHEINMMQVTPSRLKLLMSFNTDLSCLEKVEELMVGGEAFPVNLFSSVKESYRGRIYNMYGPTETTIWSAIKNLTDIEPGELTIGSPIANTRVYIFDGYMRIQPLGVAGELAIGGYGVASGYLNNVELTAEKFIFSSYKSYGAYRTYISKKIYKTGDLARWLSNGDIQFLGRIDYQIKIRGFRIELEEIEEQLMKHEKIKEAVVTAKENKKGDQYLSAYIVPHPVADDNFPETLQLREYLSRELPEYMIPSYFVQLEEMPLTPNGKINKKALPDPLGLSKLSGITYVEPQDDLQRLIARIWKEELELEKVGVNDNFFDLGGNSMDVVRVNHRLNEELEKSIPVVSLFKYRTIRSFVMYLCQEEDDMQLVVMDRSRVLARGERDKKRRLEMRRRISR